MEITPDISHHRDVMSRLAEALAGVLAGGGQSALSAAVPWPCCGAPDLAEALTVAALPALSCASTAYHPASILKRSTASAQLGVCTLACVQQRPPTCAPCGLQESSHWIWWSRRWPPLCITSTSSPLCTCPVRGESSRDLAISIMLPERRETLAGWNCGTAASDGG